MTSNIEMTKTTDAAALSAIHRACFEAGWSAESIGDMLGIEGTAALIFDDGSGFVLVRCIGKTAEILTLCVLPEARGRGLGHVLVTAAQAHAVLKEGAGELFLEVGQNNAPALAIYRKTGFAELSRRKDYYRLPGGGYEDALVMRCALPVPVTNI